MFKPYSTTYGSLLPVHKLEKALLPYVNTADLNSLEYNYPVTSGTRSIYITGYNEEEQSLPAFDHPVVVKTIRDQQVIVSDLRKYVKHTDNLEARIEDIAKNTNSTDFIITRALLTKDFLDNTYHQHRAIFKPSISAMGIWISGMVSTIVMLEPLESFHVEIISTVYANTLYYDRSEVSDRYEEIAARVISSKHAYKLSSKDVIALTKEYVVDETKSRLAELIQNIQKVLPPEKAKYVTIDSLISVMGNVWYGPGESETPIISLENMPTWLAVLYAVVTNKSYSKSRIGTILNKHSRVIDSKIIDKHFTNYFNSIKV